VKGETTMKTTPCGYRGRTEITDWEAGGYYCERHTEILRRRRAIQAERLRASAGERNPQPVDLQSQLYEAEMRSRP
jgi:hypothetical protein